MTGLGALALSNLAVAGALALVAASVGRCCRRPPLTHALWLIVLLKLVTPPFISVQIPQFIGDSENSIASAPAIPDVLPAPPPRGPALLPDAEKEAPWIAPEEDLNRPPMAPPEALAEPPTAHVAATPEPVNAVAQTPAFRDWSYLLGGVWLTGSGLWLWLAGRRVGRFHGLLRHGRQAPHELQQETQRLAERLRVRCPEVWLVPGVVSPMLWVIGRCRRLLLPEHLLARLTAEQRATLLAHELAHLRRGDPWVRYLELVVLSLYWWCPLVWWARSELREAEEECCDAWVVWALPGSARAYALALVETVDFMAEVRPALPALATGFGHVHLLRRRLTMIMSGRTPRALTSRSALALVGVGVFLLPLLPTWAQERSERVPADGKPSGAQVEQLKKLVESMRADLDVAQADLIAKQAALDALTRKLKTAMDRLKALEKPPAPEGQLIELPAQPGQPRRYIMTDGTVRESQPFKPAPAPALHTDLERRLAELERKLSLALAELQALRRELGQQPAAPPLLEIPAPPRYRPNQPPLGYVMPLQKTP